MKWMRPSGNEIATNDRPETIQYCKTLGFKPLCPYKVEPDPDTEAEVSKNGDGRLYAFFKALDPSKWW